MAANETITTILERRSVRSFTQDLVSREDLERIVACGQWAPSAMNNQKWCFIVIDKRAEIDQLISAVADQLGNPDYDMYRPAALILVAHAKDQAFAFQDDGCAMENMMLAAQSLGISSVWINQLLGNCDAVPIRALLQGYGLPDDYDVNAVCALGYAAKAGKPHQRSSTVIWV